MDGFPFMFVLVMLFHVAVPCPEKDPLLEKWSNPDVWNGSPPSHNGNVTISKRILLDVQPPTLWNFIIKAGGALVWDPAVSIHLKVHWIQVDGELHIGSEDCPFETNTRVTFLGNVNENNLGAGGDKALFVTAGGTLEIHGKPKLSWTKLDETAKKLSPENGLYILQTDIPNMVINKGLIVYVIDQTTGGIIDQSFFNLNSLRSTLEREIARFIEFIENFVDNQITNFNTQCSNIPAAPAYGVYISQSIRYSRACDDYNDFRVREKLLTLEQEIENGNIICVGVKRILAHRGDITPVLEAIERIGGQNIGGGPLRGSKEAAYALVTKKGSPDLTMESYVPWFTDGRTSVATVFGAFGNLFVRLTCLSERSFRNFNNYVELLVAEDLAARPILTLVDEPNNWGEGDKVIIASTDYDWKQAEERKLMKCDPSVCNANQVRLSNPLWYTHYGEVYKNVDMRGEIGLLSRNILFDSEDAEGSTTYGGNIKVLKGFKSVHIEGAEFNDLGQQEELGRYPIHFHMCEDVDGNEATRPWIKHNSIHHSNSRCVTVHGTSGLIVEDNVCYITHGHGYFLEDGGEKRTVFDGNLGLGTEKGTLIKADSKPSTFWITNPQTYVRNNAAAGGDGRGYWYTYPRLPLAPSDDKGFMLQDEARHTAVYEFDNNVAHSYKNHGIFVDNEFLPNTDALGYNRYDPKEDPLMHLKYKNSTSKPAIFNRLTAYKNSPRNAWIRGGTIKVTHASLSDSPVSMNIVKENKAIQYFEESVIIGDSPNVGEIAEINGEAIAIGRSLPQISQTSEMFFWRTGFVFEKGPVHLKDVFFDHFTDNEYYHMGAIGFKDHKRHSPMHSVTNAKFGFSDPSEGNRVQIPGNEDDAEVTFDDKRTFRDLTHSVSGVTSAEPVTFLSTEPFHITDSCTIRSNWNFAYCKHNYGKVDVRYEGVTNIMWATRDDDYLNARIDMDQDNGAPFLAILGEPFSYSIFWGDEVPATIFIQGISITRSESVRIGICLPPYAEFGISARYPSRARLGTFEAVSSIQEVDDKAEFFYDPETGYLVVYLTHDEDFKAGDYKDCPRGICPSIVVYVNKGDRTITDCLDDVHKKFDLSSISLVKRRLIDELLDILNGRVDRKRRSIDVPKEIPATSQNPPAGWGAGKTR